MPRNKCLSIALVVHAMSRAALGSLSEVVGGSEFNLSRQTLLFKLACRWFIMIPATLDQMPTRPISPLGCESASLGANGILATDNFHGLP
jgi:hypothetical protein